MATTAPPPLLTVGEAWPDVSSDMLWLRFGVVPCMIIICCLGLVLPDPRFFLAVPWRLPLLISWAVYMSLVSSVQTYTTLFLPLTPAPLHEAIDNVGYAGIGGALGAIYSIVLPWGQPALVEKPFLIDRPKSIIVPVSLKTGTKNNF
ncbi:hypothetical protein [Oryza sativa Japonica Group]|uniref:DUF7378 domain-containing protein n=1 Tax=Oryza sativa subsp. japonica TaxID=39947 RepID=Q5JM64_ORYSJ|nr:hypothetical protein [Oryza sativa Japonica Group]BAD87446.1 hypothetical protein [Oryza sativa Japonica Group]